MDNQVLKTLHCYGCGRDLPETAFSYRQGSTRGRAAKCRQCSIEAFPLPLTVDDPSPEEWNKYPLGVTGRHQQSLRNLIQYMLCPHCGAKGKAVIARKISSSDVSVVRVWCLSCHQEGLRNFKHSFLKERGIVIDLLPVYGTAENHVCAVEGCYRTDTELHHFLPRHINPDLAEMYPQAYLCRSEHHPLWHKLVTPTMRNGNGHKELP